MKSTRIVRDGKGNAKGIAYVDVETPEMAKSCLALDQKEFKGSKLSVMLSAPPGSGEKDKRTVYVNNLTFDVTKERLEKLFEPHGKVADVRIIKDPNTGKAKGYAYVEFATEEAAKAAQTLNKTRFEGRVIQVLPSVSDRKKRDSVGNTAHINNLSYEADEKDLIDYFEGKVGKDCVKKTIVIRDAEGGSQGFGFVEFQTEDQLTQALALKDRMVKGRPVVIRRSTRKITEHEEKPEGKEKSPALPAGGERRPFKKLEQKLQWKRRAKRIDIKKGAVAAVGKPEPEKQRKNSNDSKKSAEEPAQPKKEDKPAETVAKKEEKKGEDMTNDDFRAMLLGS